MMEGQETERQSTDMAQAWEQARIAAIEELEQAQAFLGLVLTQLRTRTGNEQDRAYSFSRLHHHVARFVSLMGQCAGKARLEGMQPAGRA